jgi:vitamin B12/bleomycin/antimicrobial peptide transport system ATP-binding/permease protein
MSLGELTQAAAAFVTVQAAFNWLLDNYQRLADSRSSAERLATLLFALDELGPDDPQYSGNERRQAVCQHTQTRSVIT